MHKIVNSSDDPRKGRLGIPLSEFDAAVETLKELQREGKYQIFLARGSRIRFMGETDDFRLAWAKKLDTEIIDRKKAEECLEELKLFLRLRIVTNTSENALEVLEDYYDAEFREAKDDPKLTKEYREEIQRKVEVVTGSLVTANLINRARRLGTVPGPLLEDLDMEIIASRRSISQGLSIEGPFLRISLQYSLRERSDALEALSGWAVDPSSDVRSFELECDETDIDLLITRLLQAKELLKQAVDHKLKPQPVIKQGEERSRDEHIRGQDSRT